MSELLTLVQDTRADVAAVRQRVDQIAEQVATLSARDVAARTELERHRADDRRELDQLHGETGRLRTRVWLMALGAVVAASGTGGAAGAVARMIGG